jgi:hypothetical protein
MLPLKRLSCGGSGMSISSWTGTAIGWERELWILKVRLLRVFRHSEARETRSAAAFLTKLRADLRRSAFGKPKERSPIPSIVA